MANSATEHERLAFQHHALVHLMDGQAVHVPLVDPTKILDVGCGTGVVRCAWGIRLTLINRRR